MNRDRALVALFGIVAVSAGGVVGANVDNGSPPVPVVSRPVPVGPDGHVSIRIVGDTMLSGDLPTLAAEHGQSYDWAVDALRPALAGADFVLAVADTPITESTVPSDTTAAVSFRASPPAADALGRAGVDALMLATEHAFDSGPGGLADTIGHADAAGILTIGAGPDLARAEQPLLLRTELGTVAVVGFGESFGPRARPDTPGAMALSPEAIKRGADLAHAAGADWVIAAVQWAGSYAGVQPRQRYWAQVFADAGYDLVVGGEPHITQPIEFVNEMPVVYSVGNVGYGTADRHAKPGIRGHGLSVDVELSRDGEPRVAVRCLLTDDRQVGFPARPCDAEETQAFLPTLNPELDVRGDVAIVPYAYFSRPDER